ncbi:uncharacterized protein EV422DRAFT_525589 [Fimicolochytrium jonesii]|uniref:uncharacterized protein n=1 Tax=Fimicolochytrium jonesii TaxID=1396493 RepID=UPI0022FEBA0E|nr:uncharacterized protein EV422DRAFT_525589 [Fimicolochytrium jonesii]KAI8822080.1 hypothetical protein EV422DRAFT_525589 [Fimicolochytrium jonesii]
MGKKDKHRKGHDDHKAGGGGRDRWVKAAYLDGASEDSSDVWKQNDSRKSGRKSGGRRRADSRVGPSPNFQDGERVTVSMLEQADRKKLARTRAPGRIPMCETIDRHTCYMASVQLPTAEVHNLINIYTELRSESKAARHHPTTLREDFCGTGVLCREWCKGNAEREAWGVDLDPDVIQYSKTITLGQEGGPECERVNLTVGNVLSDPATLAIPKVDIIAALNYGVDYFQKRTDLIHYLRNSRSSLAPGGTLIVDLFGGATVCGTGGRLFERQYKDFTYYFEQKPFDLMTNLSKVHLHFRFNDGSWHKSAFTYDFRAYSIIEMREAMLEAGFASTHVWLAESTNEREVLRCADDEDQDEDDEEENQDNETREDGTSDEEVEDGKSEPRRKFGAGAYGYERVEGSLPQLQSWNAYVVGII